MRKKVSRWLLAAAAVIGVMAVCMGRKAFDRSSDAAISLEGYDITTDHLALYEKDLRSTVSSYFYQVYHLDPNEEGFWEKEVDGQTPGQVLKERARAQAILDTVERIEARKHDIDIPVTLEEMNRALEEKNQAGEKGTGTYGPEQYGLAEYLSRTQLDAREALKEALLKDELAPSQEQLRQIYDNGDPEIFSKGFKARVGIYSYYSMKVGDYPEDLGQAWSFVTEAEAAGQKPEETIARVRETFGIEMDYEEVECDTDSLPRDNQEAAWLAEQIDGRERGWLSLPLEYGASQELIKVIDMEDYGTVSWEEAQGMLTSLWLEEAYPAYLRGRAEDYGYQEGSR